jgi:integrase
LHSIAIDKLDRRDVAELLTTLATEKGAVTSNRVRASLSAMLAWAIKQGLTEANPAAFTNKEAESSRSRVLNADELAAIWAALPAGDYGDIVRLLLLTGCRREEIGGLRWSEIDMNKGIIALPPERVKNSRAHAVPMSEPVRTILKAISQEGERDFVFGFGDGAFSGWSKSKERLSSRLPKLPEWTLHDLRRSAATGMAEIGVAPHIVEAVINHASGHKGGIAGVYNHASYEKEKRTSSISVGSSPGARELFIK